MYVSRSRRAVILSLILLAGGGLAIGKAADAPAHEAVAPAVPYDAGTVRFLANSEQTEGRYAVVEVEEQPGYLTPSHRHDHMDETFYVLEGVLRVTLDGVTRDHPAGSFVIIPRGAVHTQGSGSGQPVRAIITMTPGGFEHFFQGRVELARHTRRGEPAFREGMMKLVRENARWIQHAEPTGPDR